ncbi:hypothetical protein [Phyllobacterium sp. SB3]|uniref:hypothetical protein n=1 Tax=Phyllobacterium sp. SB3 TaxID=3156073 RepID=UPI0032AEACFB
MTYASCHDFRSLNLALVTLFIALAIPCADVIAQGLDAPNVIEKIIGTDVGEDEVAAVQDEKQIIAAIENTVENVNTVRMVTSLNSIKIIFLSDATASEGGPPPKVAAKIEAFSDEIAKLRQELEGSAMLYHAINSHGVLIRDVLAIDFDDQERATIYVAAKPSL